jgi:hypothetical protein
MKCFTKLYLFYQLAILVILNMGVLEVFLYLVLVLRPNKCSIHNIKRKLGT